jgi:hypothetical protein
VLPTGTASFTGTALNEGTLAGVRVERQARHLSVQVKNRRVDLDGDSAQEEEAAKDLRSRFFRPGRLSFDAYDKVSYEHHYRHDEEDKRARGE